MEQALEAEPEARMTKVLEHLAIARSSGYYRRVQSAKRPGPKPKRLPQGLVSEIGERAKRYPWWGYQRIAVLGRREGLGVTDKQVYRVMKAEHLLQKRRAREAELYQAAKLYELLPERPNALWQADVTYIHSPGRGWWYAVTVIDYYSRYLLAVYLTPSYAAWALEPAVAMARAEAEQRHGRLESQPILVTDNGSSFLSRRFQRYVAPDYRHVRIRYRTPEQLGLLERFHQTLKTEQVYWQLYDSPEPARSCLTAFQRRYNTVRPHWAWRPPEGGDPHTPTEVYGGACPIGLPRGQQWALQAKEKLHQALTEPAA